MKTTVRFVMRILVPAFILAGIVWSPAMAQDKTKDAKSALAAQQKITKAQLVGTWTLVSTLNVLPNGNKISPFGEKGVGMLIFDSAGSFSWQLIRPETPKMASGNRLEGTADEFKVVALGVLAYFGTYSLDENNATLTMHIQASSYPNFNGNDQKRILTLNGNILTVANATGASGGSALVTWKRL